MSRYQFSKPSKDANHDVIRNALLAHGYSVGDLASVGDGLTDLIVSDGKRRAYLTVVMEAKVKGGKFRLNQLRFLANWKGRAAIVETPDEALNAMREPDLHCLTDREKSAMLLLVYRYEVEQQQKRIKDMQIYVNRFEKDLSEILKT